jgi:hypothetical protein
MQERNQNTHGNCIIFWWKVEKINWLDKFNSIDWITHFRMTYGMKKRWDMKLAFKCILIALQDSFSWVSNSNSTTKIIWQLVRNAHFGSYPRHTESEILGVKPSNLFIKKAFRPFYCRVKFENWFSMPYYRMISTVVCALKVIKIHTNECSPFSPIIREQWKQVFFFPSTD